MFLFSNILICDLAVIYDTDLKWHYICIKSLLSIIVNGYVQIDYM